ncbi:hypothetical protein [Desulfogranum marinum]|uniref:hypothetical protein n=1 Tax=Desulfogranum marinum TaxID=453220 RepID=UPI0029C8BE72|nr:hypothetical protein [Desulfogranum marinum]
MGKISLMNAKCDELTFNSKVQFLKDAHTPTGFEMEAYTGAPVVRHLGRLSISIEGITAKAQMPIFRDHDPKQIVGYSTGNSKSGSFKVKGVFSKSTDAAKEVISLAQEGFPWQASIGVKPTSIVEVEDGKFMKVNGHQVAGPAEVWVESVVFETSFVPLGADSSTSADVFSEIKRTAGDKMPQLQTFEQLPVEERCKLDWANKPGIRAEFTEFDTYLAYMQGVDNGSIKETIKSCQSERITI